MSFKSGFITITGRPNVGKSTLLNNLSGEKIAIVTDKPQTTRNAIRAIVTKENSQMVFIDTPGIHKPKDALGKYMVGSVWESLDAVDIILFVVEAGEEKPGAGDRFIMERLSKSATPVILVVNKIDLLTDKKSLLRQMAAYSEVMQFKTVIPVSARDNDGTDIIIEEIISMLPEGPKYFPDDMITDQPEKMIAAEMIREKAISLLDDEIPYGLGIEVESFEEGGAENSLLKINAAIYCDRESQKGIIIGKGGEKLKKIGTQARQDLEKFFAVRIYLGLRVKTKKNWRNNRNMLEDLGYTRR